MNRAKNHILYELYLEELGFESVFEKTKTMDLGHIVSYIKGTFPGFPMSIEDYTDSDFSRKASYSQLEKLSVEEYDAVEWVVNKIDEYHAKKQNNETI